MVTHLNNDEPVEMFRDSFVLSKTGHNLTVDGVPVVYEVSVLVLEAAE